MTDQKVMDIMTSPTLNQLANFAQDMPIDVNNAEDLKSGLSICLIDICSALDKGRIKFEDDKDKAMLNGLLTIALAQFFDGKVNLEAVGIH